MWCVWIGAGGSLPSLFRCCLEVPTTVNSFFVFCLPLCVVFHFLFTKQNKKSGDRIGVGVGVGIGVSVGVEHK